MSATVLVLSFIALITTILSMCLLWREWDRREKQKTADKQKTNDLEKRVIELEAANKYRYSQRAADELLDAIAMFDMDIDHDEIELEKKKVIKAHLINALNVGTKRELIQKEKCDEH